MTPENGSGQHPASKTLLLINSSSTAIDTALIGLADYQIGRVLTADEAPAFLAVHTPEAILASSSHSNIDLFTSVKSAAKFPVRPLLVLIDDNPIPSEYADLTLTPNWIGEPLRVYLQMRTSMLQLHTQNETLQSEVLQLEQELYRERRLKDEVEVLKNAIVRNVSHELKTPLLQVKSAVALLAEDVKDKDNKLIEYATGATARLELLVRNITMLGGSLEINLGPIILHDAIESARRNLRRVWEHRDQTQRIEIKLPPHLSPVIADKQSISTLFQLLIDNALKFSKENVTVEAHDDPCGDYVHIFVKDAGIGIAQDQLDAIFDSFYQVDHSSTRSYGGMGVGLAIVRLILERHNSQIRVESKVGEGSVFSFTLPVYKT